MNQVFFQHQNEILNQEIVLLIGVSQVDDLRGSIVSPFAESILTSEDYGK